MMKKLLTTVAVAGAMVTTPALAQDAAFDRLPAPVEQGEELEGEAGLIIALLAAAAVIAGIIIATGTDNADEQLPASP
ncbi:hypothetical protein [Aurantiacibacter sp. D1-12]|uniref:hypothetical protein n=1 Tax=Aurantiacibacter sp. D1-12 TaxID=2993658 RepID=UPI00237D0638|nr:hypothetical protein [Aurantiacibacter sp. D1-12]MDE1466994.1 hypothetical protein [Aurantiacibacter sp. D1-12]